MHSLLDQKACAKNYHLSGAEWESVWILFLNGPKHSDSFERLDVRDCLVAKGLATSLEDWTILTDKGLAYALHKGMGRKKSLYIQNRGDDTFRTSTTAV